jgi:DNA-binding IclR family transcriptional regulator
VTAGEALFASRSMQALEVLAFGPVTVTRLAEELQIHPRTARRLLNRMAQDGWLTRRDGARPTYAPTMRIVALAAQLAERAPLVRHAHELAAGLHAATGDAVHLAVPAYRSALRLVRAPARAGVTLAARDLAPVHAVAAGKLLLAFRDPWREVVLAAPLPAMTERTLVDPAALRAELAAIRVRGLAVEDGESRAGVRALAAPVRDDAGEVVAALALSSTAAPLAALLERSAALVAAGDELSARLAREDA